ncbi:hypothetical protein HRbin31_00869 [bacterium HR31]|nr:hypothetical protein HRbin31_00869 [bacterium HR31]
MVAEHHGRAGRVGHRTQVEQHAGQNGLLVDRVVHGLPDPDVLEGAPLGVHGHEDHPVAGRLHHLHLGVAPQPLDVRRRGQHGLVHVPGQDLGQAGAGVRDHPEQDLVKQGLLAPVVGVALQEDGVPATPLLEHVRARAAPHRRRPPAVPRTLHRGRRDDGKLRGGQVRQEGGGDLVQPDSDGVLAHGLHGLYGLDEEPQGHGHLGVLQPFQAELDGLRVERGAVVETDPAAQGEGVGEAVPGDLPPGRQPGHDLLLDGVQVHQGLEHVVHDVGDGRGGLLSRVQAVRVDADGDAQLPRDRLRSHRAVGPRHQGREQRGHHQSGQPVAPHARPPFPRFSFPVRDGHDGTTRGHKFPAEAR